MYVSMLSMRELKQHDGAWQDITMTFIEGLPKSEGYNYIIVVVDKFFGPYTVLEPIGAVTYHLDLPPASLIHPVFHISQLKEYHPDYSPVFSKLLVQVNFSKEMLQPELILKRRLVQKGNAAIPQVRVKWLQLPVSAATWDDWHVLATKFPVVKSWGQDSS
jgi:hypothetical protein